MAADQHGAKQLGPKLEHELHIMFTQTLIDLEHHLHAHAAFDQWLTDHNQPPECSALASTADDPQAATAAPTTHAQ